MIRHEIQVYDRNTFDLVATYKDVSRVEHVYDYIEGMLSIIHLPDGNTATYHDKDFFFYEEYYRIKNDILFYD